MIKKEEVRKLILELYPEESYRKSCMTCSKDTGFGHEAVYKMGMVSSQYCVTKRFYELLISRKNIREYSDVEKNFVRKAVLKEKMKEIEQLKIKLQSMDSREELVKRNYNRLEEKKKNIKRLVELIQLDVCDFNQKTVVKYEDLIKSLN